MVPVERPDDPHEKASLQGVALRRSNSDTELPTIDILPVRLIILGGHPVATGSRVTLEEHRDE